jgi:hypothetical protein
MYVKSDPRPAHQHPLAQQREVRLAIFAEGDEFAVEGRSDRSADSSGTTSAMFQPRRERSGSPSVETIARKPSHLTSNTQVAARGE